MRLETKHRSELARVWGDDGPYDYTRRWVEHWLHFDDSDERKQFHALCLKMRPAILKEIDDQLAILRQDESERFAIASAKYKIDKAAWDLRSRWSRFWASAPTQQWRYVARVQLSPIQEYILDISPNANLFYGPIRKGLYEEIIQRAAVES